MSAERTDISGKLAFVGWLIFIREVNFDNYGGHLYVCMKAEYDAGASFRIGAQSLVGCGYLDLLNGVNMFSPAF